MKFKPLAKLNYFKGEKIGLDSANLFLLESAIGKYMWWFSDDDEFMPGAIVRVLELIKKYPEIAFIWVNFGFESLEILSIDNEDGFFKDGNEVLETLGTNIGLLSTYFLKREEALLALPIAKKHIKGFSFASTCVVISVLAGFGRFYFLRGPYVLCHPTTIQEIKNEQKNYGVKNEGFNVYGVNFYNVVNEFKGKFSNHAIRTILKKNFASLWRGMLVAWVGGWENPKGKRWKMFKYYWNFPEFWIAMPFFLMPRFVSVFCYKIYKIFFNERRWRF